MSFWDEFLNSFKPRESGRNFIGDALVGLGKAAVATPGFLANQLFVEPTVQGLQNTAIKEGYSPEEAATAGLGIQQ